MSLDVKVDISAKDIEAQVVQAIAASAFGDRLKVAVEKAIESLGNQYSYDNQLKKWVEEEMRSLVHAYVVEKHAETVREQIKAWLKAEKMEQITNDVLAAVVKNLSPRHY